MSSSTSAAARRACSSSIRTGAFVKEFGAGSYGFSFAHAVRVDKDDNVWAVDEGTNIIQKFSPDGKLLMVLGKRPDPLDQLALTPGGGQYSGANRPYTFHRQTDIGLDPQGNIFVSDGYGDSRVVKFDKNGRFIKAVGTRGNGPLQFSTPHAISVDAKGMVYVADRGNPRIVVLDNDLNQKAVYDHVGAPWAVCISAGPHQYLYSSNSFPTGNNFDQAPDTGEIYKMELDGTVIGRFGKAGHGFKEFSSMHQMDCRNPDEMYVVGDYRVARAEDHSAPAGGQDLRRPIGGDHEAHISSPDRRGRRRRRARRAVRARDQLRRQRRL